MAERLQHYSDRDGVEQAFRLCLSRPPSADEHNRVLQLLRDESSVGKTQGWVTVARVLLNLDETITRE